jgi:acyl-CoA thioester hydrolase
MPATFHRDIEVRWGDMDAFAHVNNGAFMRYLEDARIQWMDAATAGWEHTDSGPVVVNVNLNFRRELRYPAHIRVHGVVSAASEKRLLLEHTVVDREDPATVYADAQVTILWMDFNTRRSIPLPQRVLDALAD